MEDMWMANRHMQICSTSLSAIGEVQMKATTRYHIPLRMPKLKTKTQTKALGGREEVEQPASVHCWWECRCAALKTVGQLLIQLNSSLTLRYLP